MKPLRAELDLLRARFDDHGAIFNVVDLVRHLDARVIVDCQDAGARDEM